MAKMVTLTRNNFYLTLFLTFILYTTQISARPRQKRSEPSEDNWGKWNKCPIDSFVTGISLKFRIESEISTITSIRFYCTRQHVLSERKDAYIETIIEPDQGHESHWTKPVFCESGVATDLKVKYYANPADSGHRRVTNLKLICSDDEALKIHGHGKDKGDWSEGSKCSPRHAICGLQTQALTSSAGNVLTDARGDCCNVKNPATKCTPSDRWQLVTECENNEAIVPKTCVYNKKTGTSYAGKELETSVYENLGFTLNGVSTDLSGKVEFMEGVASIETGYKWDTATHETWMPETKTEDKVTVQPGEKASVYQVVGHCGFYRIRASQFKVDTGLASPPAAVETRKNDHGHHHKKHHDHDVHDPNVQADFGGDDDDWSDDWSDEEQVDETGKGKHDETEHKLQEQEHKEEKHDDKKESEEGFDDWDDSEEKTKPEPIVVEESKSKKHEDIPEKHEQEQEHHEKKEKDSKEDSFEDWDAESVEEKKPEIKSDKAEAHVEEKHNHSAEKKDTDAGGADSFEDWDESEEEKKPEPKVEDHKQVEQPKNEQEQTHDSFEDDWHEAKPNEAPVPVAAPKTEEKNDIVEDKKESSESFAEWDQSEEKHLVPVAPTLDTKVEENHQNHHADADAAAGGKKESEESFEDWGDSEEKKPEIIVHAQETVKDTKNEKEEHEPAAKTDLQESDATFDNEPSEQKTHEAMVLHSEHKKEVQAEKNDKKHDDEMELMAKDKASDEWAEFSEEEESHEEHKKAEPVPVPVSPQHTHQHGHQHAPHAEMHIHSPHPDGTHSESKVAAEPDPFDEDWKDWNMELPESKFDKMEKQVEPQPKPEPSSDTGSDDLKFPDSFKGTLDQIDQAAKDAAQAAQDTARAFHANNLAPLAESISTGVKDAEEKLKEIKESSGVKEVEKALSEALDAAINPPNHDAPVHPDDEPIVKILEESSTSEAQGSPKVQSAVLGYIVGGMVAGVVIIVIIIFVLERRQPKRYDGDEAAERNGEGGVRDPPLLSDYKKDSVVAPLATATNDKDAF